MLNIIIYLISLLQIDSIHYNLNKKIDSIIEFSIKEKAFPGAQIIVLKDGEKFLIASKWNPKSPELVVTHQVGKAHQQEIEKALSYDPQTSFTTYESLGNCGSVSLPITFTLACEQNPGFLQSKSALLGIGSGLSSLMLALNN